MIRLNGEVIKATIFPDKTSQVWHLNERHFESKYVHIEWIFQTESEFIHLAQLKDLLDSHECLVSLKLPYLPYGRQDKHISNEETFALRTFFKLIQSLNFEEILIMDPHSRLFMILSQGARVRDLYPKTFVEEVFSVGSFELAFYPDEGACEKYKNLYSFNYTFGKKVRDQKTGKILSYSLNPNISVDGKKILIVDDICDGGATFVLSADALYKAGALKVGLFVSHGIFSKGTQVLKDAKIDPIYTKEGCAL